MLAAMRAELLVLRKWPAAWGLLLVVPAATLLPYYVVSFVVYLTDTPAEYVQQGSPAMILPSLLPSQFVIVALALLPTTTAPFVVHIKDFKFAKREAQFVPLREGEIDWLEVYKALAEIGYRGSATVELPGGDKDYLREVSRRFDLILAGS